MSVSKEQLALLQGFIDQCEKNTAILHLPELSFYKDYLERYCIKFLSNSTFIAEI